MPLSELKRGDAIMVSTTQAAVVRDLSRSVGQYVVAPRL
jgi:hypothetical protein